MIEGRQSEINTLLNKMADWFDYSKDFVQLHENTINKFVIQCGYKNLYHKELTFSEYHVIDCIGKNHLPNSTFIAKQLDMTKGAISKITAKLVSKGLINANRLDNNKKEVYFTLTSQGKDAYEVHERIHDFENSKLVNIFKEYNEEELKVIHRFLDDILSGLPKDI
nr:MarR family transcriptional regulator [Sedimentibacter sp.]